MSPESQVPLPRLTQLQIGCSYCDTWQHFHCYGFTGPDDPRIPEDHACYQCLLAGRDEKALSALNDLALRRRGMSFALRVGLWRKGNLGKTMGEFAFHPASTLPC